MRLSTGSSSGSDLFACTDLKLRCNSLFGKAFYLVLFSIYCFCCLMKIDLLSDARNDYLVSNWTKFTDFVSLHMFRFLISCVEN